MTVESRSIGRFHASYRLPAAELDARTRLDALLERVLDAALDGALARAGVAPDEEVCVRSVAAGARLRLAATDVALVSDWSTALAEALAAAIGAGEPAAVRYRSRRQALVDAAVATAAGDLRRAWAWRQLGLWPDEDSVDGAEAVARLVNALAAEPRSVVPILVAAARRGALPRLAVLLSAAGWQRLARAALAAAGVPERLLDDAPEPAGLGDARHGASATGAAPPGEAAVTRARRLLASSALATAAAGSGAAVGLAPPSRRALAILAALEVDPGSLTAASSPDAARALVTALATELDAPAGPRRPRDAERPPATDSRSALAAAGLEPEPRQPAGAGDAPETPGRHPGDAWETPERRPGDARETSPGRADGEPGDAGALPEVRSRAWTQAGGLLFLLPFVAELEPLGTRTLRWTLHRLALALLPELDEADPAALAFAGLGPDELPPSDDGEPASDDELDGLRAVADVVAARLAERLEREDGLVAAVCARRAEVVAEPGWIEIRLALEELDIDVRRAGLDLDPGWLPWLGVVVRFVYA